MQRKLPIIFFGLILFIAFIIRSPGMFTGNRLFLFDTARDMLYVQKIVLEHDILLIGPSSGGLQGYFHGVIWYYLLAIPFVLSNGHPLASTAFAISMSLISIVAVWWVMKKCTNHQTALFAALVWSCATFSLQSTYFSWNPYMIVWLTPLYFFAILSTLNKKKHGLPLTALCVGLFIHFEAIYGITQLIPLLFLTIYTLRYHQQSKIKTLLITFSLFFLPFLPYIVFDLRHNLLISQTLSKALISGGETVTTRADLIINDPLQRIQVRASDWFTYTFNFLPNQTINIVLSIVIVSLFARSWQQKHARILIIVTVIALFAPLVMFCFYRHAVWSYYWIGNTPLLCVTTIYLLHKANIHQLIRKATAAIVSMYALTLVITTLPTWWNGTYEPGSDSFLTQQKIVQTILSEFNNAPYSVYVNTPPVYDYKYRYVLEWSARNQNKHIPVDDKQNHYALILEPSASDPRGKFFKNNQIKVTGEPYKTENIDGIVIEFYQKQSNEENIDKNILPQR